MSIQRRPNAIKLHQTPDCPSRTGQEDLMIPQAAASSPEGRTAQARRVNPGDAVVAILLPVCGAALAWAGWLIGGRDRTGAPLPWHSYPDLLGLAAAAAGLMIL